MIERMEFGKTGYKSSRAIFGAAALGQANQKDADRTLEQLLEYGVNHIDVAPSYGDAELRVGPWMREHRQHFFLATKTGKRSYQEARDELHGSLERLQTDQIDLIQMHHLIEPEEWDQAMGSGGALEALIEARDQGLVRFIGVTGHGITAPKVHLNSLNRFPFDSVLLPCNYLIMQDRTYAEQFSSLVQMCVDRGVAVQTIKAVARRPWPGDRKRNTWYEPLEDQQDINRSVHWVLAQDELFLITAGDTNILPRILIAATQPNQQPADEEMRGMLEAQKSAPIYNGSTALMR